MSRDKNWDFVSDYGFEAVRMIALDNVWSAGRFKKPEVEAKKAAGFSTANHAPGIDYKKRTITVPAELQQLFSKNKKAAQFFDSLAFSHRREYVEWIISAKRDDTKQKRLATTMEKLTAGKKNFNEK